MTEPTNLSAVIARRPELRKWFALHAAASGLILLAVALVQGESATVALGLCALMFATAAIALAVPATTRSLHVAPVLLALDMGIAIIALAPNGAPATLTAVYCGVLIPFTMQSRGATAAHLAFATVVLFVSVLLGGATTVTVIVVITALPVMWGLGGFAAFVWEQAEVQELELERLSRRDPLTGLSNRRGLDERLTYELARHADTDRPMSIVMLDLNGFKAINDDLGHAAGDELLCAAADVLRTAVRDQDTVGRQGGDEFCVVAPETGPEAAKTVALKIRAALAGAGVAAAVGAATFPDDALDAESLITVADARQRADKPLAPARAEVVATRSSAVRR
ncbi:MAG: diguanylate cyclase [Solirubrobacteraceae bacterium]